MHPQLQQWQSKVDALEVRERGLLLLAVAALLYLLWSGLFQSGLDGKSVSLQAKIESDKAQLKLLKTEEITLTAQSGVDPNFSKNRRIEQLKEEIEVLDVALSELSNGLVAADQLPKVLQDVLASSSQLHLVKVQTLPVEELKLLSTLTSASNQTDQTDLDLSTGVYKHSVLLQVEGSYFQLLSYLQTLQQLPWRFYWDSLDYQVTDYPVGTVDVRVYTLSAEEGLLGV